MGNTTITGTGSGGAATFKDTFVDADLSSGILSKFHGLNKQYLSVTIIDENDNIILPDEVTFTSTDTTTIDLTTYGTLTGTWQIIILG
jgi:hypothetical protein